ncbi:MAG: PorP/SprF family type IX secretion system membrane protein [Bacteroidota bacterium]
MLQLDTPVKHFGPCLLLFSCFLLLPFWARTQDARFANIAAAPQLTNPAMTGMMNGGMRFTANFRELYSGLLGSNGYRSIGAGLEFRRQAGNGNYFGFGGQLQRDKAGESDFTRIQGLLGFSYQQQIGGSRRGGSGQFLSGGAQIGFGQRGYDLNKLWFSNQYFVDNTTREAYLDRTTPTGEPFSGQGAGNYLDVNAGIGWFGTLGERMGAYFGVAAYHLNAPDVSPLPGFVDELDQRFVIHGGGEVPIGRGDMSLLPAVRFMTQGPAYEALFGANLRYTERRWREVALRAGLWGQMSNQTGDSPGFNAWVISVGLETERVQFGVSYDITVGNINTITNGRGGWELSMIYVQPANYRDRVICPKF